MNLLSKIKDILFNDEEADEPIDIENPRKEIIEEEEIQPKKSERILDFGDDFDAPKAKEELKNEEPEVEERDLFKANNTFNFPVEVEEDDFVPLDLPKRNQNGLYHKEESKRIDVEKYIIKKTETVEIKETPFKASPVISPVYGVMDKNYKKEDIVVRQKVEISSTQQKNIDLDNVRKKAYGTLEDEIEITLDQSFDTFYKKEPVKEEEESEEVIIDKPVKSIDDLLLESEDEKPKKKSEIEENSLNETFKLDEVITEMKKSAKDLEDTNDDLFSLIDSMYEDKEE